MAKQTNGEQPEGPRAPRLHGDLLQTTLLAYLRQWNAYGYQLAQQLESSVDGLDARGLKLAMDTMDIEAQRIQAFVASRD